MTMLTEQQVRHFDTFGFLMLRNMLTADEVAIVNREFEAGLTLKDKSQRIAGVRHQLNWSNLEAHSPLIQSLLEDERFYDIVKQLIGDDAVGSESNSNLFSGDRSPWHPDTPPEYAGLKFLFYLNALDSDTGALRAIPGSHKRAFSDEIMALKIQDETAMTVDEVPCHVCDSQPGDAILFDYRVWHASWGGGADRRMVSLQYMKIPKTEEEKRGTRAEIDRILSHRNEALTLDRAYPQYWLDNKPNNPDRTRWISQLREWGLVE